MIPETFIDGIGWIGLSDGMVRIEFVTIPPRGEGEAQKRTPEVRHRIIMTPQAFLRGLVAQQGLVSQLQKAGFVRTLPQHAGADATSDEVAPNNTVVRPPRSPNFRTE
jgi:hypothetical protein